jgi:butyrate kinase
MADYLILTINPGSTSTKIGLFRGKEELLSENVSHDAETLAKFGSISEQRPYREDTIQQILDEHKVNLNEIDAVVGRGGGLLPVDGGVYSINDTLLDHATRGANGVQHPANLGAQIAFSFADKHGKPAFVVNPPDTDELCDLARMTGIKDVYRTVHLHALNLKETAIRHATGTGRNYEDSNYIVCHIGGGISVSAHSKGKMIDGNDIVGGDGPMTPTRCGALPVIEVVKYCSKEHTLSEIKAHCTKTGGFVSHLGTADALEVSRRAETGDKQAERVWSAMLYQINKYIGEMATVLKGDVDGILLGGGMVHSETLVSSVKDSCEWIAPVSAYPGEFELEAMAAGATRVLDGIEKPKVYTGMPIWNGFED